MWFIELIFLQITYKAVILNFFLLKKNNVYGRLESTTYETPDPIVF